MLSKKALHLIYKLQWNFTIHGTSMSAFSLLSPQDNTSKQTRIRAQSLILKRHLNQINIWSRVYVLVRINYAL